LVEKKGVENIKENTRCCSREESSRKKERRSKRGTALSNISSRVRNHIVLLPDNQQAD
jgi:hypothetical protein